MNTVVEALPSLARARLRAGDLYTLVGWSVPRVPLDRRVSGSIVRSPVPGDLLALAASESAS